jgi:branched-chain amino acid transport system substrate-binding protein
VRWFRPSLVACAVLAGAQAAQTVRIAHEERSPGQEVVYAKLAAVDPDLTNATCSYPHCCLDADTSMKTKAPTGLPRELSAARIGCLIDQNGSHGHEAAHDCKETMAR